jgi:rod shape-determining protein MreC
LREVLGFELEGYYDLVAAEIVGRHIFPPVTNLTINKGERDGIEVGMPVCTREGLVGKVAEVYEQTSLAQTLHDRNCVVSCIVENSQEIGILRSLGTEELYLTGIPLDTDIREGSAIMSSGLGGVFPKGFSIGAVGTVSPDGLGLFSRVRVSPEVNFSAVSEVFVITDKIKREFLPARAEEELRPTPIFPGTLPPSEFEIPEFIDVIRTPDGP